MMRGLVSAMNPPTRVVAVPRLAVAEHDSEPRRHERSAGEGHSAPETTPDVGGSPNRRNCGAMPAGDVQTAPTTTDAPSTDDVVEPDYPWVVIVWNDPINLMSYVVLCSRSSSATAGTRPPS